MREALVDVLVDDVRLIEDEIAFDEHRHAAVGVDDGDVFGLGEEIDIDHLEIHAFFVEDDAAAVTERAGGSRIEIHHDQYPQKRIGIAAAAGACRALAGDAAARNPALIFWLLDVFPVTSSSS
jgi:hypothetical protein